MAEPAERNKANNKSPAVDLKLGSTTFELTGMWALIAVSILLALVVLLVYLL